MTSASDFVNKMRVNVFSKRPNPSSDKAGHESRPNLWLWLINSDTDT
jgi:hypothetical protein